MLTRLRDHLTYANVAATLALTVALGGTSYAAFTLPHNSVGHQQLRPGAVRSREVRNGSLQTADLSAGARRALRGHVGPAGAAGPQGPAATELFAAVQSSGAFVAGNATSGGSAGATGTYVVGFSRSVNGCATTATLGTTDATTVPAGRITVSNISGRVGIQTYAADGTPADLPFHVIVAC